MLRKEAGVIVINELNAMRAAGIYWFVVVFVVTFMIHWWVTRVGAERLNTFLDLRLSASISIAVICAGVLLIAVGKKNLGWALILGTLVHVLVWLIFLSLLYFHMRFDKEMGS